MKIDRLLERKHTADCKRVRPTRANPSQVKAVFSKAVDAAITISNRYIQKYHVDMPLLNQKRYGLEPSTRN